MPKPHWLEGELLTVAKQILNKLDQREAAERKQEISIAIAKKNFPSLFDATLEDEAGFTEAAIEAAIQKGLFIHKPNRQAHAQPLRSGRLLFDYTMEHTLREWLQRPVVPKKQTLWRQAVERHLDKYHGCDSFARSWPIEIHGKSYEEICARLATLPQYEEIGLTLRQLSAKLFWGDFQCSA